MDPVLDLDADRLGEAGGFVEPCLDVALAVPAGVGQRDDRPGAAREITRCGGPPDLRSRSGGTAAG